MDLPTVPGYEYKPLISADAVRVVVLEPAASFESTLRCSLIQYSRSIELGLSDRQHYSAVSYTWGDEPASRQLLVTSNDLEHPEDTMLLIRPHVDSFLRHFRKAHKTVYLWVDAICLNQQDGVEKGQQIQLMGDIFKTAKKVHVWLGEDEGLGAKTFSVIRKLNLSGTDREGSQPKKTTLSPSDVDLLSGLLQKPWFTRRWVIQEIALARHAVLHWGESSLENSWLLSILPAMENSLDLYSARMLLTAREASIRPLGLLELLWRFDGSECGDRRDRVAALMGLVSASQRIAIDYNADDCKSIYARLATQLINESPASAQLTFVHLLAFG
ncbi:HET-domain-containing protein, partial [Polyplosphaeria fusca]